MQLLRKGLPCTCDIHLTDRHNLHCRTSGITDIQLISEEDTFLWLKAEKEKKKIAPQGHVLQMKYHATKVLQQKQIANEDYTQNCMRKYTILYPHALYCQKNNT
jgi:hypothetical protein